MDKPIKIELIDNATNGVKFDITLDDLEDMAECIHNCSWVSIDELFAYMKAVVTSSDYEPEDWSVDGKGEIKKDRSLIVNNES